MFHVKHLRGNKMSNIYGYIRVSTAEQNINRQTDQLTGCDKLYIDKLSGKNTSRPELKALLHIISEGDIIKVVSIDRLARNIVDLRQLVDQVIKAGAEIQFIKESMTFNGTPNPMNKAMLNMLGTFAELERDMINARINEGIAARRDRGGYKLSHTDIARIKARVHNKEQITIIAREYDVTRRSIYEAVRNH
jgi:DNA invertase Pin-like site-specific DNA recombinase